MLSFVQVFFPGDIGCQTGVLEVHLTSRVISIYNDFRGIVEQMPLKIQVEPDLWLPFSCNLANEDINKGDYEHVVLL